MTQYVLDPTGARSPLVSTTATDPVAWLERDMEFVLAQNSDLFDADDAIPVCVDGGTTEAAPDLLYLDRAGRLTVVELKKVEAGIDALAQLLGYGEHLRWAGGELDRMYAAFAADEARKAKTREAIAALAKTGESQEGTRSTSPLCGSAKGSPLENEARRRWGDSALALRGAPARMILVAPAFSEPCLDLARRLVARQINVQLVQAHLERQDRRLILAWAPLVADRRLDWVWQATTAIMADPDIARVMLPNGWAEHISKNEVSFALRECWPVKLYLKFEASEGLPSTAVLWTRVPHRWTEGDRKPLVKRLLAEVPGEHDDQTDVAWTFRFPDEQAKMVGTARGICETLQRVFMTPA